MAYNIGDVVHISDTGLPNKPRGYGVIINVGSGSFFFINSPAGKSKYFGTKEYIQKNQCYMIKKSAYPALPGDSCISCVYIREIRTYDQRIKKISNIPRKKASYHLTIEDMKGLRDHILSLDQVVGLEKEQDIYRDSFNERIKELESTSIH